MAMADSNLSIPVKLDAFVLNEDSCSGGDHDVKIAPITQPNYTFLRIDENLLQNDVLDHVDIHNARPARQNPRVTDLGTGLTRTNRLGVYLHWMMPRPYRSGNASSAPPPAQKPNPPDNNDDPSAIKDDPTAPKLREPPNRWLVIRRLDPKASTTLPAGAPIPKTEAWVIESDRVRYIDDLDEDCDLQVDISPFITSSSGQSKDPDKSVLSRIDLSKQAETFIGYKKPFQAWLEDDKKYDDAVLPGAPERVSLALLNSANQLFPDYQPHNSNVFSIVDNFSYEIDGKTEHLTDAVADYYVLGWHSKQSDGLLAKDVSRRVKLKELSMKLNDEDTEGISQWLDKEKSTGTICHGAMYQVKWHSSWSKPVDRPVVPGDAFTQDLATKMPVGIGTTSLDSMLAYIASHEDTDLEKNIATLGPLLRAQSDSLPDQQAGQDEVQNYNFVRITGGTVYAFPGDKNKPAKKPSADKLKALSELNEAQALLDGTRRIYQQKQWDLFALWWKFVTSPSLDNSQSSAHIQSTEQRDIIWKSMKALEPIIAREENQVNGRVKAFGNETQATAMPEFVQLRDPAIFIGGAKSGWPVDFLSPLRARLDQQITTYQEKVLNGGGPPFLRCIPESLRKTALLLVNEFASYSPLGPDLTQRAVSPVAKYPPLYHDRGDPDGKIQPDPKATFRDSWFNTQAWFPLFVEWEMEYFHVDFEKWQLKESTARHNNKENLRYGIKRDQPLFKDELVRRDRRVISGRVLLLPQPTFSLAAQLELLFSSIPQDELDKMIGKQDKEKFIAQVNAMPFLSAPLSGFSNHLLTLAQGSHLKPNVRVPGKDPIPIKEAYKRSEGQIGIGYNEVLRMGIETDLTPYGSLVGLAPSDITAFKPAAHGQFRFTKLNIIDKFGQCADAIDQRPRARGPPALFPCLSDYYQPQIIAEGSKKGFPNVPILPESPDECEFAQVPPQINQTARLNAAFVIPTIDPPPLVGDCWRPVDPWENPIWGWVVVNYVNNGLQFFLDDGTFYRELRVSAPNNTAVPVGKRWLPFGGPRLSESTKYLDQLIAKLSDPSSGQVYLEKFVKMVTISVNRSKETVDAYFQFVSSLVGRPLALVNAALSIELASDEKICQSDMEKNLSPNNRLLGEEEDEHVYKFKVKLGEKSSDGDGLVGYFCNSKTREELNMDLIYTSHVESDKSFQPIEESTFPKILPYWIKPDLHEGKTDYPPSHYYQAERNNKLSDRVFGLIMDPFLPVHVYSATLPVTPLKLPEWTWQSALKNMTTFFHMGPLVTTSDVPRFDFDQRLTEKYSLREEKESQKKDWTYQGPEDPVGIPALKMAEWSWLQPYRDQTVADATGTEAYMALPMGVVDAKPRFERGPYTAIEGYLQMKRPIETSKDGGTSK